jgi:glycosyltransferase involved in cell wall biosynthesis
MHGPGAGGPSGPESKERMILSIGRFFGAASGHSKKQVELVRAFRRLVGTGLDGWRLVLVGGCDAEHRDYAMQVRREAAGLPVEVRFNAPGSVVQDLLGRAALYWHGAGWGEDEDAHPDRMEHFGIAVVEAMSAGAVPLVFGAAGPAEVVVDGVSGRHFRTEAELVARTRELVDDEALRRRFAEAAVARAREFAWDRFTTRLWQLVDGATVSPARPAPR